MYSSACCMAQLKDCVQARDRGKVLGVDNMLCGHAIDPQALPVARFP